MRAARTLHQFPRSHYCEKIRWHLDVKGLDYQVRNLFPGTHARINRRLVGHTSVPVLLDGDRVIHNSATIALYLESTYPGRRLLPEDDGLRALVLALQAYFDNAVGPAVRHWLYGQLLRKRGKVTKLFFHGYPRGVRLAGRLISPIFERQLARLYPPDDASMASAQTQLIDGIERLENTIEHNPDRYLVGATLTLADITAAALLAPVVGPPESPWNEESAGQFPPAVAAMRERLRARPGGQWVMQRYAQDRSRPRKQLAVPEKPVAAGESSPSDDSDGSAAARLSIT